MIAFAPDIRLTSIAQTRLASSRGLQPRNRSAPATPALRDHALGRAVALDDPDVVAIRQRREPARVDVDHRDLVVGVQRFDDRAADVARPEHDDLHDASVSAPPSEMMRA